MQATQANQLVSVIVPIYNAEKYLDQCLSSIREQAYSNLEIICINDGSTDDSLAIVAKHAALDDRIRIIDKENAGYGAGCNRGMDEAHGEWLAIVEPDDWIEPGMYATCFLLPAHMTRRSMSLRPPGGTSMIGIDRTLSKRAQGVR